MRSKHKNSKASAEWVVKDIRRQTGKQYNAEEKIRMIFFWQYLMDSSDKAKTNITETKIGRKSTAGSRTCIARITSPRPPSKKTPFAVSI